MPGTSLLAREEDIMICLILRTAVARTISGNDEPIIMRFSATNWLAPANTTSDMKRLSNAVSPAVLHRMPHATALGI